MIKLLIFLILVAGAFYFGYEQGLGDAVCVQTQNYLSTPYLANPKNLNVESELEIITIEEKTLS